MVGRPKIGRYRANMLRLEESLGEKGFPHSSSNHFVVFLTGHRWKLKIDLCSTAFLSEDLCVSEIKFLWTHCLFWFLHTNDTHSAGWMSVVSLRKYCSGQGKQTIYGYFNRQLRSLVAWFVFCRWVPKWLIKSQSLRVQSEDREIFAWFQRHGFQNMPDATGSCCWKPKPFRSKNCAKHPRRFPESQNRTPLWDSEMQIQRRTDKKSAWNAAIDDLVMTHDLSNTHVTIVITMTKSVANNIQSLRLCEKCDNMKLSRQDTPNSVGEWGR